MLVISRNIDERLVLHAADGSVLAEVMVVTVSKGIANSGTVRLGVSTDPSIMIRRAEIPYETILTMRAAKEARDGSK